MICHRPSGVISYEYAGLIYRMHELKRSRSLSAKHAPCRSLGRFPLEIPNPVRLRVA